MASEYNVEVQDHEGNVYHPTPDILSTKEELMANNDAGKTPDALLVKQLNSDLNAMNDNGAITGMDAREDGVYITYVPADGADAVTRKLGSPDIEQFSISSPTSAEAAQTKYTFSTEKDEFTFVFAVTCTRGSRKSYIKFSKLEGVESYEILYNYTEGAWEYGGFVFCAKVKKPSDNLSFDFHVTIDDDGGVYRNGFALIV